MALSSFTSRLALPLLAKELIEQAARKRTYIVRVVYASLLFLAASLMFYSTISLGAISPMAVLGQGRIIFEMLMGLQFVGVYLFMPALTCSVLTQEKEHNSLMLLFLTKLGPWTILFEKLLSRMIPMGCFLLLSLPLLAYAYTLGGITQEAILAGAWMLFTTVVQCASAGLLCSAFERTTVRSFIRSYLLVAALVFGPPLAWVVISLGGPTSVLRHLKWNFFDVSYSALLFPLSPMTLYFEISGFTGAAPFGKVVLYSLPTLAVSAGCLLLARAFVVRRAFPTAGAAPSDVLGTVDKAVSLGSSLVSGADKRAKRRAASLPETAPIAWRETAKRSMGRMRYLVAMLLMIELLLIPLCSLLAHLDGRVSLEFVAFLLFPLWVLAVLIVSVQAASLITSERSRQTLDVLCVMPIAGRDIIRQKMRGVMRLVAVLALPLLTVPLLEAYWMEKHQRFGQFNNPASGGLAIYIFCWTMTVAVYLPLVAWFSLLVGLVVKSHARSIMGALGGLVAWCVLPPIFIVMPVMIFLHPLAKNADVALLFLLSPASILFVNELGNLKELGGNAWATVFLNFAWYGFLLLMIRRGCLKYADYWLGRAECNAHVDELPPGNA